jgi:hypothetical protein
MKKGRRKDENRKRRGVVVGFERDRTEMTREEGRQK